MSDQLDIHWIEDHLGVAVVEKSGKVCVLTIAWDDEEKVGRVQRVEARDIDENGYLEDDEWIKVKKLMKALEAEAEVEAEEEEEEEPEPVKKAKPKKKTTKKKTSKKKTKKK